MLDAQFVQCLRSCPFASATADLSDISMKPLSQNATGFPVCLGVRRGSKSRNRLPDSAQTAHMISQQDSNSTNTYTLSIFAL